MTDIVTKGDDHPPELVELAAKVNTLLSDQGRGLRLQIQALHTPGMFRRGNTLYRVVWHVGERQKTVNFYRSGVMTARNIIVSLELVCAYLAGVAEVLEL